MQKDNTFVLTTEAIPLSPDIVKILVGTEETLFCIHEDVLTARSKFFENAMRPGSWEEADTKTVKLPDDNSKMFALYAQLVYTGVIPAKIYATKDTPISNNCDHPKGCAEEYESLCRLYVFSEKIQDVNAKNAAISALVHKINDELKELGWDKNQDKCFPHVGAIKIMYEGTGEHDKGRKILVDCYGKLADCMPSRILDKEVVLIEFFQDVVMELLGTKPSGYARRLSAADYEEKC